MPPPAKAAAANTIRLISFFIVPAPPDVGKRFNSNALDYFVSIHRKKSPGRKRLMVARHFY
jgi:hypothetical protein